MKKILMSLLAMGTLTSVAMAGCSANGCYNVKVKKLLVATSGDILVATDGDETALNCGSVVGQYMTVPVNNPGKNAMYSMFLTAMTTDKSITAVIIPSTTGCKISYANTN